MRIYEYIFKIEVRCHTITCRYENIVYSIIIVVLSKN